MRRAAVACAVLVATSARADDDTQPQPTPRFTSQENTIEDVSVRGVSWASPRGVFDMRIRSDLLEASPRQQATELLSAAPGFFVDHEDGEGFGNDVRVRGFDFEHGAGVEMRLGSIPINAPVHVLGSGYADPTFIIPEVVQGVRVLQGTFDPRQGDAAVGGSAYFDLGVARRGELSKISFGSFGQMRVLGVFAPRDLPEEDFAAFAVRHTDGFGESRAGTSASAIAQYGFDVGPNDHFRMMATAYDARFDLAGVVREDDVAAGRIGFYDAYPGFGQGQSVQSARVVFGADYDHETARGDQFEFEPFFTWTNLDAKQNFTGSLTGPLGDMIESRNSESALGFTSRYRVLPTRLGRAADIAVEPGVFFRAGHTEESRSTVTATTFAEGVDTLDAAGYVDVDLRLFDKLRISGGLRADLLAHGTTDRVAGGTVVATDAVVGPRATIAWDATRGFTISASYGEGFRSREGPEPYTRVRSFEVGMRAEDPKKRWTATLAIFDTFTDDELVFDATSASYEPEGASTRRGIVGSVVTRPTSWLVASAALSVVDAEFLDPTDDGRWVPDVAPIMLRLDANVHHAIGHLRGKPVIGRVGVGYTYLARPHLTDTVYGTETNALNARVSAFWNDVEVGVEGYDLLNLRYPDDEEIYVSNWSGTKSLATHSSAAAPASVIADVALRF